MEARDNHAWPKQVQPRLDGSALQQVSSLFESSISEIFGELYQNARRAGATRIDVTCTALDSGDTRVHVSDDGHGIARPELLLSFGESGWDHDGLDGEEPAGMGFFALARQGCSIVSRPAGHDGRGWTAQITPGQFNGDEPVNIRDTGPDAEGGNHAAGTDVGFVSTSSIGHAEAAAAAAARYLPLPVHVNGQPAPREDFLDGCGTVVNAPFGLIGVSEEPPGVVASQGRPLQSQQLSFHGLLVDADMPSMRVLDPSDGMREPGIRLSPRTVVRRNDGLLLQLPTRRKLLENEAARQARSRMREAMLRHIAEMMTANTSVVPSFEDWRAANRLKGVKLPPPAPWLPEWTPPENQRDPARNRHAVRLDWLGKRRIALMDDSTDMPCTVAEALRSALDNADRDEKHLMVLAPVKAMEGYAWYDGLDRVIAVSTEVRKLDGEAVTLERYERGPKKPWGDAKLKPGPVDAITFLVEVEDANGNVRTERVENAQWAAEEHYPIEESIHAVTGADTQKINIALERALCREVDDISWTDELEDEAMQAAAAAAVAATGDRMGSIRKRLNDAALTHLSEHIPHGMRARLTIENTGAAERIEVEIEEREPARSA